MDRDDTQERLKRFEADFAERGDVAIDELREEVADVYLAVLGAAAMKHNPPDEDETDESEGTTEPVLLQLDTLPGEEVEDARARFVLTPEYRAADTIRVLQHYNTGCKTNADLKPLIDRLDHLVSKAKDDGAEELEATLVSQVQTLDALFNDLTRKAFLNMENNFGPAEKLLKLALRAQANCRATVESFGNLKRPVVKQTNIAHGPQQVNIHPPEVGESSQLAENENPPNELLEKKPNEWMDRRAQKEAVGADSNLEAVAKVDGAKVA